MSENAILEYAAEVFGNQNATGEAEVAPEATVKEHETTQASAEIAAEGGASQEAESGQEAEATTEGAPEAAAEQPSSPETVDHWKLFEERTEGFIKDEETLNIALERARKYEEVLKEKDELAANQFKPANSYIETLNKMATDGASKDQVKAFIKLNEWGDINDMSPEELLVAHKVLLLNNSEEVARWKTSNEHNLSSIAEEYGEDSMEYKAAKEEQRLSAERAKTELESYRKELTTVDAPKVSPEEQQRLDAIARQAEYTKLVEKEAPKIAKEMPTKASYGGIEVSYTPEFIKQQESIVKDFFTSTGLPINKESLEQAEGYAKVRFFVDNEEKIVEHMKKTIESELTEKISNKYENRSGLAEEQVTADQPVAQQSSMDDFYRRIGAMR